MNENQKVSAWLDELEADSDDRSRRAAPRDAFEVYNNPEMVPASKATTVQLDEPVVVQMKRLSTEEMRRRRRR